MVNGIVKRPRPTSSLIMELCGGNTGLLSRFHHGLSETSLRAFYPNLNLEEVAAFEIGSYIMRAENPGHFKNSKSDIYWTFREALDAGFPRLNTHKTLEAGEHEKLNPFGRNLRERLERANQNDVNLLKSRLAQAVNKYVFECDYENAKIANGGDNSDIKVLFNFPKYPRKGKVAQNFADEIARILREYPREYTPFQIAYQMDMFE